MACEGEDGGNGDDARPLAVILAAGAGRRIGGGKALVPLAGRPLAAHVVERLAPQVSRIALNAAEAPGLERLGLPLLPDARPGLGPLSGILAAMRWAGSQGAARVLTVAVDTPFLPDDLARRLAAAGARAAFAETADGAHPTTGLWSVDLAGALDAALFQGTRKVRDWTRAVGAQTVRFDDADAFFNVNTPEDLRIAEARLKA
ncbi:molybdenum cofactor guanylyltransferase MobA [Roseibacterium sp. SDUM158017]|uniref:molybdenum cofactor guanylyltransferase MobA n=1 Tax=Roseicyclus salinarum TaxID=3036773 RepID=UPI0024151947|nr:molybdenum cofactor guanylyltransferase MobA [Roseibacterium sp. SDUM158017]MDG4648986.1 molybdenum cofactor guanylyltransferase MobA [Roseibacterium sp. SDUM158017]